MNAHVFAILFFLELGLFFLLLYLLIKADNYIKNVNDEVKQDTKSLSYLFRNTRDTLRDFNKMFKETFAPKPLSTTEFTSFVKDLASDVSKIILPGWGGKKNFQVIKVLSKIYRNRDRIVATFPKD